MLEKPISFLRKLVSFRKCFHQIAKCQNTFCFGKTLFKSVLKVFCPKTLLCFAIHLTIVITSVRTLLLYYHYIENRHISPAPSPFSFCRQPPLLSATVNVVVAATAASAVAAVVSSSPISPSSFPPLFCLCHHRLLLPSMLPSLMPLLLPSPPLSL